MPKTKAKKKNNLGYLITRNPITKFIWNKTMMLIMKEKISSFKKTNSCSSYRLSQLIRSKTESVMLKTSSYNHLLRLQASTCNNSLMVTLSVQSVH